MMLLSQAGGILFMMNIFSLHKPNVLGLQTEVIVDHEGYLLPSGLELSSGTMARERCRSM